MNLLKVWQTVLVTVLIFFLTLLTMYAVGVLGLSGLALVVICLVLGVVLFYEKIREYWRPK